MWLSLFQNYEMQFRNIKNQNDFHKYINTTWSQQQGIFYSVYTSNSNSNLNLNPISTSKLINEEQMNISNDTIIHYGLFRGPFSNGQMSVIVGLTIDQDDLKYIWKYQPTKIYENSLSSIAAFLTFSHFATSVNWCSKDVLFVIIERKNGKDVKSYEDFDRFIDEYFDEKSSSGSSGDDRNYNNNQNKKKGIDNNEDENDSCSDNGSDDGYGSINRRLSKNVVGGLIVDIPLYMSVESIINKNNKNAVKYIGALLAGPKGSQPNMDIFSVIQVCARRVGYDLYIAPYDNRKSLLSGYPYYIKGELNRDSNSARLTMLRSMAYQASGQSNGYHGSLVKHQIDALTLKAGRNTFNFTGSVMNTIQLMQGMELWLRSMSNLIEVFHHHTYNYIILSSGTFVTMTKYFPSLALMMATPLIHGLGMYRIFSNEISQGLIQGVGVVLSGTAFGLYTYTIFNSLTHLPPLDTFVVVLITVFMLLVGFAIMVGIWRYFDFTRRIYYVGTMFLVDIFSVFGQFWLPLCLNFSAGVITMLVTVLLLLMIHVNPLTMPIFNPKKHDNTTIITHVFSWKRRLFTGLALLLLPFLVLIGLMTLFDLDVYDFIDAIVSDIRDKPLARQHPVWFVVFGVIQPLYFMIWFFLIAPLCRISTVSVSVETQPPPPPH